MKDLATAQDLNLEDSKKNIPEEVLDPEEGHPESTPENEEDPSIQNEENPEDPDGAPEGESEELDPLKKAKKFADQKISELGAKASSREKSLVAAVRKSPELLIEMYDPSSELYDKDLANKIRSENPDVYQVADRIYKERMYGVQDPTEYGGVSKSEIERIVAQKIAEAERRSSEVNAFAKFRESLGYSEEQFEAIRPGLASIASSIKQTDPSTDMDSALKRAFIAMFPSDYEKTVKKEVLLGASKKAAMTSSGAGGSSPSHSQVRLSKEDQEALEQSGLSRERFLELRAKNLI